MKCEIIGIDVETTGFDYSEDITKNHQIVSIGLLALTSDFRVIDKFYREIKWNGTSHWSPQAEKIHGLTKDYLENNGISEEDAVADILEFLINNLEDINKPILFLGHNVRNFDIPFFKKLTSKFDVNLKIAHRAVDSFTLGYTLFGTNDSNELFSLFGYERTTNHNALEDVLITANICRKIKKLWGKITT